MLICYLTSFAKIIHFKKSQALSSDWERSKMYKHQLPLFNKTIKLVDVITKRKIQMKFPSTYAEKNWKARKWHHI